MGKHKPFAVTVEGGDHKKQDKGCQDCSRKYGDGKVSIAAVADGHGDDSCFRSAKGADYAANCAVYGILRFINSHKSKFPPGFPQKKVMPQDDEFREAINVLLRHIIAIWQTEVEKDYTANPFTKEELEKVSEKHRKKFEAGRGLNKAYGTTLIACAITPHYWLGIHIGDGRLTALYPDGTYDQPVPWDEKCFLNATTSICDDDASDRARFYFSFHAEKAPPVAVFLCSDGIDDNYPVDGNEKHLFKLYRTIAINFDVDGFDSTCKQLEELANSFATKGKGDDTSIAGFIDMDTLKQAVPVWQKQIAEEEEDEDDEDGDGMRGKL